MGVPTKLSICLVLVCIGCSDVSKNSYSGFVSDMDTVTFDGQIMNQEEVDMAQPVVRAAVASGIMKTRASLLCQFVGARSP